jgi:hypothetical protein
MSASARRGCVVAVALLAVVGCGSEPGIVLTSEERALWAPQSPDRSVVPVLRYRDVDARQLALLAHAGYRTITLDQLVRFVKGRKVGLPAHPLVLTVDNARPASWARSDAILSEQRMQAVLFVDVGRVEADDTWDELDALARNGRWNVQLQSGTGNRLIRYGPRADDVGPFYAYRGEDEVLGGWRERVFSDVTYGEEQLAFHVDGYRPLAFAPPYGNYGQAGSNDPRIARELLARLKLSFQLVFTQDRSGLASAGATNPLGRFDVTRDVTDTELHALITSEEDQR